MPSFDLVYFEPESAGYHSGHAKIFIERAVTDPRIRSLHFVVAPDFERFAGANPVELALKAPKISFEYIPQRVLENVAHSVSAMRRGLALWKYAVELVGERPGAVCFLNFFDNAAIGAVFQQRKMAGVVTGIIHAPPVGLRLRRPINEGLRWMSKMASYLLAPRAMLPLVFTFDNDFAEWLPSAVARNWRYVPDPVPLRRSEFASAFQRNCAQVERDRVVFLIFGSLGARKGLFKLLEAVQVLPVEALRRIDIRIAGVLSEASPAEKLEFDRLLTAAKRRQELSIEYTAHFLTNGELVEAINGCDVVLAPYANHVGVSSVLLWAAAGGKPVISQDTGWMGRVVRAKMLGLTCNSLSVKDLADTIATASEGGSLDRFDPAALRAFAEGHSADDFYEALVSEMQRASACLAPAKKLAREASLSGGGLP